MRKSRMRLIRTDQTNQLSDTRTRSSFWAPRNNSVRARVAENGMESTASPFETTLNDRYLPFHDLERR